MVLYENDPTNGYEAIARDYIADSWTDVLTGIESRSLGAEKYKRILSSAGFSLISTNYTDEGENYYYVAKK